MCICACARTRACACVHVDMSHLVLALHPLPHLGRAALCQGGAEQHPPRLLRRGTRRLPHGARCLCRAACRLRRGSGRRGESGGRRGGGSGGGGRHVRGGNGGGGGGLRLLGRSEPPPRRVTARALVPRGRRRGHGEAIGALPLGVWLEGRQSNRLVGERPPIRSDLLCLNATESAVETAPNAPGTQQPTMVAPLIMHRAAEWLLQVRGTAGGWRPLRRSLRSYGDAPHADPVPSGLGQRVRATTKTRLLTVRGVTARLKRTVAERPATRSTVALHLKRLWSGLGL